MTRRLLLVVGGFAVVYLYASPYFERLRSANELPRVLTTQELVNRGTFRIDARLGELGSTFDVARTPDGHAYANKAPGVSLLGAPIYGALRAVGVAPSVPETTRVLRALVVTLPALLFLYWFHRASARFAPGAAPRRAALVAYGLGSMALPYGLLFFSHQLAAVLVGGAFIAAMAVVRGETARPGWCALAAGVLGGLAVLVDYQALLGTFAVGVYLFARAPARLGTSVRYALGGVPSALALGAYHASAFGSPLRTAYSFAPDPAHQLGVLGIVGPSGAAFFQALLAPSNGLFVLMPWALLALVGAVAIWRSAEARARVGAEALCAGAVVLAYVVFLGCLVPTFGRGGWSVGPRYIAVAVPFLGWLAGAGLNALDGRRVLRAIAHGLVLAGVAIHVLAATTFPHWPDVFVNPLYELALRLVGDGLVAPSVGSALGLPLLVAMVPLYVAVIALALGLLGICERGRRASTLVACMIAALLITAYAAFPRTGPRGDRAYAFVTSVMR
ncbi:MAG: hypothetical protein EXR73_12410 [Myxococcales bacterium]|nr:hypothetical protein [Myxococcales bacterium]